MDENFPKRHRWLHFRLRTLLIAVLVLSLPLSWFAVRLERARRGPFILGSMVRLLFLSGLVTLAIAANHVSDLDAPDWFVSPVYESCWNAGMGVIVLWVFSEILMVVTRRIAWRVWLLVVAFAVVYVPWFYVFPASWNGQAIAEFDTWHLLPLFAVMHMVSTIVFLGAIGGIVIAGVSALVEKARRQPGCEMWHH